MENGLFTGTSVPKAYLKLSMPLVFSMVVTLIYNLADTYFVARTGNADLVAGVALVLSAAVFGAAPGLMRLFLDNDGALMLRCQVVTMVFVAVLLVGRQLAGYNGILLAQAVADTLTMLGAVVLFRTQLQKHGYA